MGSKETKSERQDIARRCKYTFVVLGRPFQCVLAENHEGNHSIVMEFGPGFTERSPHDRR